MVRAGQRVGGHLRGSVATAVRRHGDPPPLDPALLVRRPEGSEHVLQAAVDGGDLIASGKGDQDLRTPGHDRSGKGWLGAGRLGEVAGRSNCTSWWLRRLAGTTGVSPSASGSNWLG